MRRSTRCAVRAPIATCRLCAGFRKGRAPREREMMTDFQPVDVREREQAIQPDRSFIVKAPAGSGKTGLLVQRILALLGLVERPESVVAMTFTIKAGSEMRERVIRALREAEGGNSVSSPYEVKTRELASRALANDRARGWNLLAD